MNIISRERFYINSLIVKQNRGGFYRKVGVNLFLSSAKEGQVMKLIQEEKYEYEKFMFELAHKAREAQKDFDKLSEANKARVINELEKVLAARGLAGIMEHINRMK